MKRKYLLVILLAGLALTVFGCGATKEKEGETTTLSYSIWSTAQEDGMNEMARAFEEENPTIKVDVEVTPWVQYWTKLDAAATGENLPDVFWMHSNESSRYMTSNVLLDLTEMADEELDMSKYPEKISELYQLDNKIYGIPKDIDTIGLWYNKTLFDEAGLAYPDDTWTWDTMLEAAKKLTNKEKGIYGMGAFNTSQSGYYNYIFQNDGEVMNPEATKSLINEPNSVEAIQFYTDLILKHKVSPTVEEYAENSESAFFESGRQAMGTFGSFYTNEFAQNEYVSEHCDVAVLPKQKSRATVSNGLGYAISAQTKNKEAALKFVAFLGSEKANQIQAKSAGVIPAYDGTASAWVDSFSMFNSQVFIDMLEYSQVLPYSSETVKTSTVETEVLTKVFSGDLSVEEGTKEIEEKVNSILE